MDGAATGANAEQIRYWNEVAAPRWIAFQRVLDEQLRSLGERAMERAPIAAGDRVLDVGCGCGMTTLALAGRVGPTGSVVGVDVAAAMLQVGRDAAAQAGVRNVSFAQADAQEHGFPRDAFDVVYSRFGVMFFADPVAAFTNLRRALRPAGRLAFVCWQGLFDNPWMAVPLQAAAACLTLPPPPPPGAPGPFSFADAERVRGILERAGFSAIGIESLRETLTIGGAAAPLDAVVEFLLNMGPAAAALREADPAVRPRVATAVREALAPLYTERGTERGLAMPSAAWIVTATA